MSERLLAIAADVETARRRLLFLDDDACPRLIRLDLEEEAVAFEIDGWDGSFTAFPADPYPSGQTMVYGPDDFEVASTGSIEEVILATLKSLACGEPPVTRRAVSCDSQASAASPPCSQEVKEVGDCVVDEDWVLEVIEESPIEPSLSQDLERAKVMLGVDAVSIAQLSSEKWRVRLCVPISMFDDTWESEIDSCTANAWGLDINRSLSLELHIPTSGYAPAALHPSAIFAVWQDGFEGFALEKQLIQILRDFCLAASADPTVESCCTSTKVVQYNHEDDDDTQNLRKYEAKKAVLIKEALSQTHLGFLGRLARYMQLRLPTVHEYCSICDQPFFLAPMFLRTVCSSELCTYQFAEYGDKITTAEGVNTQAEIVDLLVCMLLRAATSPRREIILDPYPTVYAGDKRDLVFHPKQKDYAKLQACLRDLLDLRKDVAYKMGAAWSVLTSRMSLEGAALVKWAVASNRSFLAPLQDDERIEAFRTPYQYLLISAPPEKERQFQALKREHGSTFAFHGSPAENWHSILRNGLKNASHTKLMTTGAAYGPGIYLSTQSSMSLGYASRAMVPSLLASTLDRTQSVSQAPELKRQKTGNRFLENSEGLVMMAVCEVIDDSSKLRKHSNIHIWVAPEAEMVCTRFFLVFTEAQHQSMNVCITGLEPDIRNCMHKLKVGQLGSS